MEGPRRHSGSGELVSVFVLPMGCTLLSTGAAASTPSTVPALLDTQER